MTTYHFDDRAKLSRAARLENTRRFLTFKRGKQMEIYRSALLDAVKWAESAGGKYLVGPLTKYGRAKGAYQMLDSTALEWHKKLGIDKDYDPFHEPMQRIIADYYLAHLEKNFGNIKLALAAWNWGLGNMQRLIAKKETRDYEKIEADLPSETQGFVKKVMSKYREGLRTAKA